MRLSDFIRENKHSIIGEWESFARTLSPAAHMTTLQLRDHIEKILSFIADDLESPQTAGQQISKSHGKNDSLEVEDSAAEIHGNIRHDEGFDIVQMVSEYRALRSSVIKLWTTASNRILSDKDVVDLTRFNESIDQALAESIVKFNQKVDYSKDLLLGVLGHDIRSPLGAMHMCAQLIPKVGALNAKQQELASQIIDSGARISDIISTLLDLTRARVGMGLPILKAPMDIGVMGRKVVDEMQIQHPDRSIVLEIAGDGRGEWDSTRIGQLFSNLIGNAVQYGTKTAPINVLIKGEPLELIISVHNDGVPISPRQLTTLFNSFIRGESDGNQAGGVTSNLGLGLFITKEIVIAHEGTIKVISNEKEGTTFSVHLPKVAMAGVTGK
jgi:signal transduction histidine kinase